MEAIGDDGSLSLERTRAISEVETGYTYFREGDVTIAKITPCFENGKGALMQGLAKGVGFGTTELIVARPKPSQVQGPFLNWTFRSPNFRAQGEASMYGAGGQKRVPDSFVRDLAWSFPPLDEQAQISAFLDRETAKIDALIAEQEKLIALLAEKRQATISHAVTKGLDPNAPMKDSGIPWLGEVPAHWSIKRLRFVAELNPSKSELADIDRETEVSFLPMEAIGEDGSINLERTRPFAEVETGYTYFRDGDVTLAKITPCFENGKGALMQGLEAGIGFGTTEIIVARPKPSEVLGPMLNWIFRSPGFRAQGEASMYGAGGQKRVPDDFIRNFVGAFPPADEQERIVAFLDGEFGKFVALGDGVGCAIRLLKERRSALIAAAVTGKIDLRGVV
ncbi:hypothetical protein GCM10027359_30490 [Marilutibacter aestuarii]